MSRLIYSMGVSADGYIAGPDGEIDWAAPDAELHRFHNEQSRELGAHLCGRRLYEVMLPWELPYDESSSPEHVEFAQIWQELPKVVFSTTLSAVEGNATLATEDPASELAKLRRRTDREIAVGGAGLAATMARLGLIDEYRLFVNPVAIGSGTRFFPALDERIELELLETRTFGSRVVYLRYARR